MVYSDEGCSTVCPHGRLPPAGPTFPIKPNAEPAVGNCTAQYDQKLDLFQLYYRGAKKSLAAAAVTMNEDRLKDEAESFWTDGRNVLLGDVVFRLNGLRVAMVARLNTYTPGSLERTACAEMCNMVSKLLIELSETNV